MVKSYAVPISVKAVVIENNMVWLRKNERSEWELPGGKMEATEQPDETLKREVKEELGFKIKVSELLLAYNYKIGNSTDESKGVLILIYNCVLLKKSVKFELNGEAGKAEFACFSLSQVANLNIPEFYKTVIFKTLKND